MGAWIAAMWAVGGALAAPAEGPTAADVHALVRVLGSVERFPVALADLERASGLDLPDPEWSHIDLTVDGIRLSLSGTGRGSALQVDTVRIRAEGTGLHVPPVPPRATAFDRTIYAYLPTVEHIDRVGERYRGLRVEERLEQGERNVRGWTFRVDGERGAYTTEAERKGLEDAITGLLTAIREDRFEPAYAEFMAKYPENRDGSHELFGSTVVIRAFDDRVEGRGSDFLEEDGLIAYVGIHVYNERHSEVRHAQPWLFRFFGIERMDARRFWIGSPYNPVRDDLDHPQAGLTNPLPDISAAGHRDGGKAYYANLEWRDAGWTFECPGFYPHDGKTVAEVLDPALLELSGFTVTHSRKRKK